MIRLSPPARPFFLSYLRLPHQVCDFHTRSATSTPDLDLLHHAWIFRTIPGSSTPYLDLPHHIWIFHAISACIFHSIKPHVFFFLRVLLTQTLSGKFSFCERRIMTLHECCSKQGWTFLSLRIQVFSAQLSSSSSNLRLTSGFWTKYAIGGRLASGEHQRQLRWGFWQFPVPLGGTRPGQFSPNAAFRNTSPSDATPNI